MRSLCNLVILGCCFSCSFCFDFEFPDIAQDSRVHYKPGPPRSETRETDCGVVNVDKRDPRTQAPWNAAVLTRGASENDKWVYAFSGTVIGPSTILTLGRRLWENVNNVWKLKIPNGRSVLVGVGLKSTNLDENDSHAQLAEVVYVRPHTKFNEKTRIHDVAILNLKHPLNLTTPYVRAACLPSFPKINSDAEFFTPGTVATHGGFDWHSRNDGYRNLKVVQIVMQTYDSCLQAFRRLESDTPFYLYCARVLSRGLLFQGGLLQHDNLCNFYGSTPVIKVGSKHYIVGINSVFTLTGPNFSCDKHSVNWFSRLNGSLPWIKKAMECGPYKWSCDINKCIDIGKVCDQKSDCSDNSDENPLYCRGLNFCSANQFECGIYDDCVSKSNVCDFKRDCINGEDEDASGICSGQYGTTRGCMAIQQTEGVIMECENPDTNTRVDCLGRRQVALGVRAKLSCSKYYISALNRPTVTRQCGKNGQWTPALAFGCYPDCGKAEKALNLLIVNGTLTSRDLWPWHVAIFKYNSDERTYLYNCGGSLIHRAAVLSAAHCFLSDTHQIEPESKFKIVLAPVSSSYEHNLVDPHAQVMDIRKLSIPDEFNVRNYQSDLAVIQLSKVVVFDDHIRPVCYPTSTDEHKALENFQLSSNSLGQVIGFGIDESLGVSSNLKFANLPVVSTKDCFEELKDTPKEYTYCAGYLNGTSVCNGDSGGGMVFQSGTGVSPRYFVQGIVSHGPRLQNSILCNSHSYAIFTKVGFFSEWIDKEIYKIDSFVIIKFILNYY